MNHEQFRELINQYIDEGIGDAASAEMFEHLGTCKECRNLMRSSLQVRSYYQMEEPEEIPASLDRRVFASANNLHATASGRSPRVPLWGTRLLIPLPAAAAIAILILAGGLLFMPLFFEGPKPNVESPVELISKMPPELQQQIKYLQGGDQR